MKIVNRTLIVSAIVLLFAGCSGNTEENNGTKEPDTDATDALYEDASTDGTSVDTTIVLDTTMAN